MKLKYYIGALFVFIVLLGLYVYSLSGESYTIHLPFSETSITLLVALWYVIPVIIFFFIVVFLEFGGKYRLWRKRSKYKQDYRLILEQIENQLLSKNVSLKQPIMNRYKALSTLLHNLTLDVKEGTPIKSGEARIDELIETLGNLKRGEYVNLKKFSPPSTSSFVRQNMINHIHSDEKFALEVLKKSSYEEEYRKEAFKKLLDKEDNIKELKRYVGEIKFDKEMANQVLGMCYAKKLDFNQDEILQLCAEMKYTKEEYLHLARKMKECYEPSSWVSLFEALANKNEAAEIAYFYVLLELEMIDEAKEKLATYPENEFLKVRAYLDLKDLGKKYPLELFLLD